MVDCRVDGASSIWSEWFGSWFANVLVPYAFAKAPASRPTTSRLLEVVGETSEGDTAGTDSWELSPMDSSLCLLQEYIEINPLTKPVIDQWQKECLKEQ